MGLAVCAAAALAEEPEVGGPAPASASAAEPGAAEETAVGPSPDVPTVTLADAVAAALTQNFAIQSAADAVVVAKVSEGASRAQFFPQLVPAWQRQVSSTTSTE